MMNLIRATTEDLPRMEMGAREFYASSRFLQAFDMERFIRLWTDLLTRDIGAIFAFQIGDAINGAIGGVIYPDAYNGHLIATEMFWFVQEGYRGEGLELYRAFELWARKKKCAEIRMVHLLDSMPGRLAVLYRRWGYEPAEIHYRKELQL